MEIQWKSIKINGAQRKFTGNQWKINGNLYKLIKMDIKIIRNLKQFIKINENR